MNLSNFRLNENESIRHSLYLNLYTVLLTSTRLVVKTIVSEESIPLRSILSINICEDIQDYYKNLQKHKIRAIQLNILWIALGLFFIVIAQEGRIIALFMFPIVIIGVNILLYYQKKKIPHVSIISISIQFGNSKEIRFDNSKENISQIQSFINAVNNSLN